MSALEQEGPIASDPAPAARLPDVVDPVGAPVGRGGAA